MTISFVEDQGDWGVSGAGVTLTLVNVANNDLVLCSSYCFNRSGTEGTISTSGYSEIANLKANNYVGRLLYHKWVTGDTKTIAFRGSGNSSDGLTAIAAVFRGAPDQNLSNRATATGGQNLTVDPPAIVPPTANACIVCFGGHQDNISNTSQITGFLPSSAFATAGSDTNSASSILGYKILTGGAGVSQDPGSWLVTGSNAFWQAWTVALLETLPRGGNQGFFLG